MRIIRVKFFIFIFLLISLASYAQEESTPADNDTMPSDQQIGDFSLSGYGDRGKKSWDLSGKSADIFTDVIKLKKVIGNLYGKEEDVNLKADKGDFNKANGTVYLEDNVVITTTSGTKLTTDSLNWDRKNQVVTTPDVVNIERQNMVTQGKGAVGYMGLKQVSLQKDVKVDILPQEKEGKPADPMDKTIITCDGPLEVDYEKNVATFNNNVKVERPDSTIYSDKMELFFLTGKKKEDAEPKKDKEDSGKSEGFMGNKIDKIIATGHVRVVRGENVSYSEEAIYSATDKKLTLRGRPKLILYSTEGLGNASFGN